MYSMFRNAILPKLALKPAKRPPLPSTCLLKNIASIRSHGKEIHSISEMGASTSKCASVKSHATELSNLSFPIKRSSASNLLRSKITFNTSFKLRRNYSAKKNYRKFKDINNRSRQSLKIRNSQRDRLCSINCININETVTKKRKHHTENNVKFIAGLSDAIYNLIRDKRASDLHGINKINTFIFKRRDNCTLCPPSNTLARYGHSKRSHSTYTSLKKWTKYEPKKKEFQSTTYYQIESAKASSQMLALQPLKTVESRQKIVHVADIPHSKKTKDKTVPLYCIVKQQTCSKNKIKDYVSGTKYRIGSNDAFLGILQSSSDLSSIVKKKKTLVDLHQSHDGMLGVAPKKVQNGEEGQEDFMTAAENRGFNLIASGGVKIDKTTQEVVATTLRGVLKPLLETDQEVKSAIERLEKNLAAYFENHNRKFHSQTMKSVDPVKMKIEDPISRISIEDALKIQPTKEDPTSDRIMYVPSLERADILEPEKFIAIIAKSRESRPKKNKKKKKKPGDKKGPKAGLSTEESCKGDGIKPGESENVKKEEPCAKPVPCNTEEQEKNDPDQKENANMKQNHSGNKESGSKSDPCKKGDSDKAKIDPCKAVDQQKKDPGKKEDIKQKKDPCAKPVTYKEESKKSDPSKTENVNIKQNHSGNKEYGSKSDPCKKEDSGKAKKDPCKAEDQQKKDPYAKPVPCNEDPTKSDPSKTENANKKQHHSDRKDPTSKDPCKTADHKKEDPCKKKDPCEPIKKSDPTKTGDNARKNLVCQEDDLAKKDDPCKKEDPCKKDDPCKKPDPCQKEDSSKKEDPCKKVDPCKKPDPCQKEDPCKKVDPCKKPDLSQKEDPCKKVDPCKKPDPCQKEDPSKKNDPCKKPDPCQKEDPCKKKPNQEHPFKGHKDKQDDFCKGKEEELWRRVKSQKKGLKSKECIPEEDPFKPPPCKEKKSKEPYYKIPEPCLKKDPFTPERKPDCKPPSTKPSKVNHCQKGVVSKKEDPCKKKIPSKPEEKPKPMGPSEVSCPCIQTFKRRNPCANEELWPEPKLPLVKPKCEEDQIRKHKPDIVEKGADYCSQVPMPSDCPLKIEVHEKKVEVRTPSCTQRPCGHIIMEPKEPPNCCKPKVKPKPVRNDEVAMDRHTLKEYNVVQEPCHIDKPKPPPVEVQQAPTKQEKEKLVPKDEANMKVAPKECTPPSEIETRYCTNKKAKKVEAVEPKPQKCPKMKPCKDPAAEKPRPTPRCAQQVLKKHWVPVKVEKKVPEAKSSRVQSQPVVREDKSRRPRLTTELPKPPPNADKGFVDSCKGVVSSICKVFCPGKGDKSGKRAANITNSNSMPELRTLANVGVYEIQEIRGLPVSMAGSSGNNKPKGNIGLMFLVDDSRTKRADKPEDHSCGADKDLGLHALSDHSEHRKTISKNRAKPKQRFGKKKSYAVTFKVTDHAHICKMDAIRMRHALKKGEKRDNSLFNQAGEKCKERKSNTKLNKSRGGSPKSKILEKFHDQTKNDQDAKCQSAKSNPCESKHEKSSKQDTYKSDTKENNKVLDPCKSSATNRKMKNQEAKRKISVGSIDSKRKFLNPCEANVIEYENYLKNKASTETCEESGKQPHDRCYEEESSNDQRHHYKEKSTKPNEYIKNKALHESCGGTHDQKHEVCEEEQVDHCENTQLEKKKHHPCEENAMEYEKHMKSIAESSQEVPDPHESTCGHPKRLENRKEPKFEETHATNDLAEQYTNNKAMNENCGDSRKQQLKSSSGNRGKAGQDHEGDSCQSKSKTNKSRDEISAQYAANKAPSEHCGQQECFKHSNQEVSDPHESSCGHPKRLENRKEPECEETHDTNDTAEHYISNKAMHENCGDRRKQQLTTSSGNRGKAEHYHKADSCQSKSKANKRRDEISAQYAANKARYEHCGQRISENDHEEIEKQGKASDSKTSKLCAMEKEASKSKECFKHSSQGRPKSLENRKEPECEDTHDTDDMAEQYVNNKAMHENCGDRRKQQLKSSGGSRDNDGQHHEADSCQSKSKVNKNRDEISAQYAANKARSEHCGQRVPNNDDEKSENQGDNKMSRLCAEENVACKSKECFKHSNQEVSDPHKSTCGHPTRLENRKESDCEETHGTDHLAQQYINNKAMNENCGDRRKQQLKTSSGNRDKAEHPHEDDSCQSKSKANKSRANARTSVSQARNKYPWKQSKDQEDSCDNVCFLTKKSMEDSKRRQKEQEVSCDDTADEHKEEKKGYGSCHKFSDTILKMEKEKFGKTKSWTTDQNHDDACESPKQRHDPMICNKPDKGKNENSSTFKDHDKKKTDNSARQKSLLQDRQHDPSNLKNGYQKVSTCSSNDDNRDSKRKTEENKSKSYMDKTGNEKKIENASKYGKCPSLLGNRPKSESGLKQDGEKTNKVKWTTFNACLKNIDDHKNSDKVKWTIFTACQKEKQGLDHNKEGKTCSDRADEVTKHKKCDTTQQESKKTQGSKYGNCLNLLQNRPKSAFERTDTHKKSPCGKDPEKKEDGRFVPKTEEEKNKYKACEDKNNEEKSKYGKCPSLLSVRPKSDCFLRGTQQKTASKQEAKAKDDASDCEEIRKKATCESEAGKSNKEKQSKYGTCPSLLKEKSDKECGLKGGTTKKEPCEQTEDKARDCFVPDTEEEKRKYKTCDEAQGTEKKPKYGKCASQLSHKEQNKIDSKNSSSCAQVSAEKEIPCFKPKTDEEKKQYKTCDDSKTEETTRYGKCASFHKERQSSECDLRSGLAQNQEKHDVCDHPQENKSCNGDNRSPNEYTKKSEYGQSTYILNERSSSDCGLKGATQKKTSQSKEKSNHDQCDTLEDIAERTGSSTCDEKAPKYGKCPDMQGYLLKNMEGPKTGKPLKRNPCEDKHSETTTFNSENRTICGSIGSRLNDILYEPKTEEDGKCWAYDAFKLQSNNYLDEEQNKNWSNSKSIQNGYQETRENRKNGNRSTCYKSKSEKHEMGSTDKGQEGMEEMSNYEKCLRLLGKSINEQCTKISGKPKGCAMDRSNTKGRYDQCLDLLLGKENTQRMDTGCSEDQHVTKNALSENGVGNSQMFSQSKLGEKTEYSSREKPKENSKEGNYAPYPNRLYEKIGKELASKGKGRKEGMRGGSCIASFINAKRRIKENLHSEFYEIIKAGEPRECTMDPSEKPQSTSCIPKNTGEKLSSEVQDSCADSSSAGSKGKYDGGLELLLGSPEDQPVIKKKRKQGTENYPPTEKCGETENSEISSESRLEQERKHCSKKKSDEKSNAENGEEKYAHCPNRLLEKLSKMFASKEVRNVKGGSSIVSFMNEKRRIKENLNSKYYELIKVPGRPHERTMDPSEKHQSTNGVLKNAEEEPTSTVQDSCAYRSNVGSKGIYDGSIDLILGKVKNQSIETGSLEDRPIPKKGTKNDALSENSGETKNSQIFNQSRVEEEREHCITKKSGEKFTAENNVCKYGECPSRLFEKLGKMLASKEARSVNGASCIASFMNEKRKVRESLDSQHSEIPKDDSSFSCTSKSRVQSRKPMTTLLCQTLDTEKIADLISTAQETQKIIQTKYESSYDDDEPSMRKIALSEKPIEIEEIEKEDKVFNRSETVESEISHTTEDDVLKTKETSNTEIEKECLIKTVLNDKHDTTHENESSYILEVEDNQQSYTNPDSIGLGDPKLNDYGVEDPKAEHQSDGRQTFDSRSIEEKYTSSNIYDEDDRMSCDSDRNSNRDGNEDEAKGASYQDITEVENTDRGILPQDQLAQRCSLHDQDAQAVNEPVSDKISLTPSNTEMQDIALPSINKHNQLNESNMYHCGNLLQEGMESNDMPISKTVAVDDPQSPEDDITEEDLLPNELGAECQWIKSTRKEQKVQDDHVDVTDSEDMSDPDGIFVDCRQDLEQSDEQYVDKDESIDRYNQLSECQSNKSSREKQSVHDDHVKVTDSSEMLDPECAFFDSRQDPEPSDEQNREKDHNIENNVFVCKLKRIGTCEELVCRVASSEENCYHVAVDGAEPLEEEENGEKLLKCRILAVGDNNPIMVCKVVKPREEQTVPSNRDSTDMDTEGQGTRRDPVLAREIMRAKLAEISEPRLLRDSRVTCHEKLWRKYKAAKAKELLSEVMKVQELIVDDHKKELARAKEALRESQYQGLTFKDLLLINDNLRKVQNRKLLVANRKLKKNNQKAAPEKKENE